jgi:predicted Zn-ribbon and HTH transcriptional regulator
LSITIDRKLDEAIRTLSKETDIPVSYIIEMGMKFLFEHSELLNQALNDRVQRETVEKVRMQQGDYIPLTTAETISSKRGVDAVIQCRKCGYVLSELTGVNNIRLALDHIRKLNMRCPKCKSNELMLIIK